MRAKLTVLGNGLAALDEHVQHLVVERASFSKQVSGGCQRYSAKHCVIRLKYGEYGTGTAALQVHKTIYSKHRFSPGSFLTGIDLSPMLCYSTTQAMTLFSTELNFQVMQYMDGLQRYELCRIHNC